MPVVRRILNCAVVALLGSSYFWGSLFIPAIGARVGLAILLGLLYIGLNISPRGGRGLPGKLRSLGNGCELLWTAGAACLALLGLYLAFWLGPARGFSWQAWVLNGLFCFILLDILLLGGGIRLFIASGQLSASLRVMLLFLWWVPVLNVVLFARAYATARREYKFQLMRFERNRARSGGRVCATRYPLVLVHGIFFRDWKLLNYWGRIPAELEANGATVYYGHQQSSASVERSAQELKDHLLGIMQACGCEKLNIIAHSKGGLDARYAISCLGMDGQVASLTTINTPHRGCRFARRALDKLPGSMVAMVSRNYDKMFTVLGDEAPDFMSGVSELTDDKCAELNRLMPDMPGVLYQSVGSKMASGKSAGFPLNLGYGIINAIDGENDGLVAVSSMPWGSFTMLEPPARHGISHADMIDLTRRDIPGFDVCEVYVGIVSALRERGL